MMKCEDYIKKHRTEFDAHQPNAEKIWKRVQQSGKQGNPALFWKIAAVFLLVLSLALTLGLLHHKEQHELLLSKAYPEFKAQEQVYVAEISLKYTQAQELAKSSNYSFKEIQKELKEIDLQYEAYMQDLGQDCCNEQIITVFLDYYEKKIQLLNRILFEIQKQKEHENEDIPYEI